MIPGIGNSPGEKLGNKWQKLAHAKKTATKPLGHGWLKSAASGQSQSPAGGTPGLSGYGNGYAEDMAADAFRIG